MKFQAFADAKLTILFESKKYRNAAEGELVHLVHDNTSSRFLLRSEIH